MDLRERLGSSEQPTQEVWDACFDESVYDVVLAMRGLSLAPPAASVWRACLLHPAGMLEQFTKELLELLAPGAFNAMVENVAAASRDGARRHIIFKRRILCVLSSEASC